MSSQAPTGREAMNLGMFQLLASFAQAIGLGDFLGALVQKALGCARVQSGNFTATGASQALTFAQLGMVPPLSTDYQVIACCETAVCRVDESTKTVTGFTLLGTTNTEVINVIVTEDDGPAAAAVAVSSNAGTLAAKPAVILDIIATAGTTLGRKVLKIGGADVLAGVGEVVWDGNVSLRFNAADAVTAARVVSLPTAGLSTSLFDRRIGQRDLT